MLFVFFCFVFKQKTASDIWYGLVGSEMCIRDRGSWKVEPPGRRLVFLQLLIGVADLALSAAALWALSLIPL